jgi:subtilase family serine protease
MSKRACLSGLTGLVAWMVFVTNGINASLRTPAGTDPDLQTPVRSLITGGIDENNLVTRWGNSRSEATALNDRGRLPDGSVLDHMLLLLQRSPEQEQALNNLIVQLHDRKSPNFHHWLTPAEFGEKYGVGQEDLGMIKGWLESHGFTVNVVYPSRLLIDFSGTAGQVQEAFHTEIHQISVNGEKHIANMSDPRIPAALAPAVAGVVSLHDFRPHGMLKRAKRGGGPGFTFGPSCGFLTGLRDSTTNCEALMPPDLATIYNLNPLFRAGITGKGQTIAVIEDEDPYSLGDWNYFRKAGGLALAFPYGSITQTHPGCLDPGDLNDTTDDEVAIDMEWASAAAPNAAIQVAVCGDTSTTFGGLIALQNLLNAPNASTTGPAIISISYGESESENGATQNAAYSTTYQQGVTEGVSIFVSSGDEGAASSNANGAVATRGITVSGFTSTPYNISVGGTDFGDAYAGTESTYWNPTNTASYGSAVSYIPEIPWNDSCADMLNINFLNAYYSSSLINGYGLSGVGVCNTYPLNTTSVLLTTASGSGGPSNCATGAPTTRGAPASGGTCAGYAKPSWQAGILGNPSDGVRDIPDVSLMAGNGLWNHFYFICMSNPAEVSEGYAAPCSDPVQDWPGFGGTSVSSPIWAGIQALVNQKTGERWGLANTVYYAIANAEYGMSGNPSCNSSLGNAVGSSCVFYDVTQGSIYLPCASLGAGPVARLYNCYRPSTTDRAADIGVMSAAPMTFPGLAGPGPVTTLNVTAPGSGYNAAPRCMLTGGGGSGATCAVSISGGGVTGITLIAGGSGYTSDPGCALTGGGGTGAICASIINGVTTLAPQAYPTQVGWDFATGIGTVNAYNLVMSPLW